MSFLGGNRWRETAGEPRLENVAGLSFSISRISTAQKSGGEMNVENAYQKRKKEYEANPAARDPPPTHPPTQLSTHPTLNEC